MAKKNDIPRRVIDATLTLAAQQGWRDTSLGDIAAAANVSLADLYTAYRSKAAILRAFSRQVDGEVVSREDPELKDQPPRDRVFDVVMRRFDVLRPHKDGVRAIVRDSLRDPLALVCGAMALPGSMAWMLEAAGVPGNGCRGRIRAKGLTAIYLDALRVWFEDDSDDMVRTMSTLDKRLRQAESIMMLTCRRRRSAPEAAPAPN